MFYCQQSRSIGVRPAYEHPECRQRRLMQCCDQVDGHVILAAIRACRTLFYLKGATDLIHHITVMISLKYCCYGIIIIISLFTHNHCTYKLVFISVVLHMKTKSFHMKKSLPPIQNSIHTLLMRIKQTNQVWPTTIKCCFPPHWTTSEK